MPRRLVGSIRWSASSDYDEVALLVGDVPRVGVALARTKSIE